MLVLGSDKMVRGLSLRLDRGMDATPGSLITAFDYVWARLTGRLIGLTDEEYFWEPVAGCWSLRQGDGVSTAAGAAVRLPTQSRSRPSPGGSAMRAGWQSAALPIGGSGTAPMPAAPHCAAE